MLVDNNDTQTRSIKTIHAFDNANLINASTAIKLLMQDGCHMSQHTRKTILSIFIFGDVKNEK